MSYWAVSDVDSTELRQFAEFVHCFAMSVGVGSFDHMRFADLNSQDHTHGKGSMG